jgi:2-C-methyl-D-erythritol 4-phosphate cytidylyltransferase
MGGERPRKPLLDLGGQTIVERACAALGAARSVGSIVVVGHPDDLAELRELARCSPALAKVRSVVAGGAERTDSVRAGTRAAPEDCDVILVHDAARPLVRPETVERAVELARRDGAAVVAVPVRDTLKRAESGLRAVSTVDRTDLWAAQTPQAFRAAALRDILARAAADGFKPTDDAALYERYLGPVTIVRGEEANLKITTPEDLALAEAILAARERGARP